MGKGNGGTRKSSPSAPNGVSVANLQYSAPAAGNYVPVTDRGMTEIQAEKIRSFENAYRNGKIERGMTVDKNGSIIQIRKGGKRSIRWYTSEIPKDGILTHTHPILKGAETQGRFYKNIGKSFSGADINVAITFNLSEIRAVTPNYTFSMRRKGDSWGVDADTFKKEYNRAWKRRESVLLAYANSAKDIGTRRERFGRLNTSIDHSVMKELAAKYGFIYTRSKKIK